MRHQASNIVNERKEAILQEDYRVAIIFVDEIAELMNKRAYGLQRIIWSVKGTGSDDLDKVWSEYFQTVKVWTAQLESSRMKILRYFGEEAANKFLDYNNSYEISKGLAKATSIQAQFIETHSLVKGAKDCASSQQCTDKREQIVLSQRSVEKLSVMIRDFINYLEIELQENKLKTIALSR